MVRLARIGVLKRAGFPLADIGVLLAREGAAAALIEARIVALRRELHVGTQALHALETAWRRLDSASQPTLEQILESMVMSEKLDLRFSEAEIAEFKQRGEILGRHFTAEERERMRGRAERLGEAGMQQARHEWPRLIAAVRAAMEAGTPPSDPAVVDMGRRWHALVQAFTGGDAAIARKLKAAYDREPEVMQAQGLDPAMFAYVGAAMRAAGLDPP